MSEEPSLAGHTVYRPADLSKLDGRKLPVVVWGNGACVNAGNSFRNFLTEIASYGYVVVASGPIDPEWPKSMRPPTVGPDGRRVLPPPATKSGQLVDAIDWATSAKNPYLAQTDAGKVAVMGQSCGGVQALEASADRRTTTTVIWNSGIPIGGTNMAGGKPFLTKEDLKALHAPIAYFVGDLSDQAHPNAQDDFDKLTLPVFLGWERGVPHGGTYRQPNGGEFAGVAVAWLNWRLKDDARSKKMFVGDDCGLCVNPRWVVRQKNLK
ncbi:alpha/beta hydrolase [Phenylobacterium sp. J367]|uniref:alpha/beta hydrolase n=1 Tax=Phenylobacterium sp. J367 TaxID=2898435 RepID=UPI002151A4A2|nr:alpha/beta hydrolase [Phenylobacterium sp. J367]MCR5877167.1 alpha/beta hydrolase [Phenylobacterium sp. J367]